MPTSSKPSSVKFIWEAMACPKFPAPTNIAFISALQAQNISDFQAELIYNISIALLAKSTKAVEVLPNL